MYRKAILIGVLILIGASAIPGTTAVNNKPATTTGLIWTENFDSYAPGSLLGGQGGWFPWENAPGADAYVTDVQSLSPSNSVDINGASDMVHEWTGVDYKNCTFRAWSYVPEDYEGENFLILLSDYNGAGSKWDLQIYFDSVDFMLKDYDSTNETPYLDSEWVEIRVEIDFELDIQQVYYNDILWLTKSWTQGTSGGGLPVLDAVDLWANGATTVYWDDLSVWATEKPPEPELEIETVKGPIGITATINNIGDAPATNVNWTISLDGGIILVGKTKSDIIAEIPVDGSAEMKIPFVLGFGKTTIQITAECAEGVSISKDQDATVLLIFVLIK